MEAFLILPSAGVHRQMPSRPEPLYDALILRCSQLQHLCARAAWQANEPGLRALLDENAQSLDRVVADLRLQRLELGGAPRRRNWLIALETRLLARAMRGVPGDDQRWLRLLARREAHLLHLLEQGILLAPPDAALSLRRLMPRMRGVHLDMHGLVLPAR
jgi:hypothetical protein